MGHLENEEIFEEARGGTDSDGREKEKVCNEWFGDVKI